MSINTWDKLAKAQRDYPKPRYASAVVDKASKKDPKNPYLITWTVDLQLQQNNGNNEVLTKVMESAHHVQPIVDTQLLAYMYRIYIEVLRRAEENPAVNSIGTSALGTWQRTAKNMQRKLDRVAMWDLLFYRAVQQDCWEDVRFAIINYNKEAPLDKKQAHYSTIIATQLAAEQRAMWKGPEDRMAQLQQSLALKQMKQAYMAPPDDPIAVSNITDLRFVAQIYMRQKRCTELQDLWDDPPNTLEPVIDRHRQDVQSMMIQYLREQEIWPLLQQHCLSMVKHAQSEVYVVGDSKSKLWELCAWRWDLWSGLLAAARGMYPEEERRQKFIREQLEWSFRDGVEAKDRPLQLTYIKLRNEIGVSMLPDCKDYFQNHSHLNSCFNDLKPIVCRFSVAELREFMTFTLTWTNELLAGSETSDNWRQHLVNMLKFHYLLAVTMTGSAHHKFHGLLRAAVKISQLCPEDPDVGFLVVYTLLNLQYEWVKEGTSPRILLQAAMFARHLIENDKDKQNRTFTLLTARLHLTLGLGTVAFRLYRHVKSKEMLTDTLSPYLLSRISQTHPFEAKGYGGFSAEKELTNAIDTIERMERKADSFLFNEIPTFVWGQATDTLALKRRLGSSLTKHICVVERRRIARLKGESASELPILNMKTFDEISDNVDRKVFPDFEHVDKPFKVHNYAMGSSNIPLKHWVMDMHAKREVPIRILYGENNANDFDAYLATRPECDSLGEVSYTKVEEGTKDFWQWFVDMLSFGYNRTQKVDGESMLNDWRSVRKGLERFRMPGETTLPPEEEPLPLDEANLQWFYGLLEVCRCTHKLCDWLSATVLKAKNHPNRAGLSEQFIKDLREETKILFKTVRDVAESYIVILQRKGVRAIKAQVRWGVTGEALSMFLSDDDVEYYAKEYVESSLEAWRGVLKVKFK